MEKEKKKFVIIDGNAILHRSYHALPKLTTATGVIVNAVYGFASVIIKILRDMKPGYIAVAFDRKEPTFRHQMYKEYKAKRPKAPDDLYAQLPIVKDMLHVFGIKTYEKAGFEADDIIATLANTKHKVPVQNIIVTGDMDTLQLVGKNTVVHALKGGIKDVIVYDEEKIKERYGLSPDQLIDYKALRGDPSDNIPGIRGIGEKTAVALLKEFGTLEQIYKELVKETEKIKRLKDKTKKLLLHYKPDAFEGKELVKLLDAVPVDFSLGDCEAVPLNMKRISELFEGLGFQSLMKRLVAGAEEKQFRVRPEDAKKMQQKLL